MNYRKQEEDEERRKERQKKEIPKTISELYLLNRMEMQNSSEEYQYYRRLVESIQLGAGMLKHHPELKKKAIDAITSEENHPEKRNMKFLSNNRLYSCSTGEGITGKVTVRPEELEIGEISLRNQQCNTIIRQLMGLDYDIYSKLIEEGTLRSVSITHTFANETMKTLKDEIHGKE